MFYTNPYISCPQGGVHCCTAPAARTVFALPTRMSMRADGVCAFAEPCMLSATRILNPGSRIRPRILRRFQGYTRSKLFTAAKRFDVAQEYPPLFRRRSLSGLWDVLPPIKILLRCCSSTVSRAQVYFYLPTLTKVDHRRHLRRRLTDEGYQEGWRAEQWRHA